MPQLTPPQAFVICHDSLHPIAGAGGLRTLLIAKALRERGWAASLIGPCDVDELDGVPVHRNRAPSKRRSQILSAIRYNVRLLRIMRRVSGRGNVLVIHNALAGMFALLFRKLYGHRILFDITDLHAEYFLDAAGNPLTRTMGRAFTAAEYWIIRQGERIVVVSENMKQALIDNGIPGERIGVVHDGVNADHFPTAKGPEAAHTVGHVGLVDKQHGVPSFVRGLAMARKDCPELRGLIVGDGRVLPEVRRLADDLGVADAIEFTGHLSHDKIPEALCRMAIGVIPRPMKRANHMVVTLKLMEYWASGTAVIASPLAGIREVAEDGVDILFFDPAHPETLANALVRLRQDPELRTAIAQRGREKVSRQFRWPVLIVQVLDFLGLSEVPR